MIQAYAQGRINPDDSLLLHLDHCLGCMACEAMCPSQVAYGRLIDNAQAMLASQRTQPSRALALLLNQTRSEGGLNRFTPALRWYNSSGMQKLASGLLGLTGQTQARHSNKILGLAQTIRLKTFYPAINTAVGDVALFIGCMGTSFDGETLQSAIRILTALGYNIHVPQDQQCCGALHQHHGQPDQAQQLIQKNRLAFGKPPISHIIYTANGCGAQLAGNDLGVPVRDIMNFLLTTPAWEKLCFKPLTETVYIHESCSSHNKLRIAGVMPRILKCIPQLQIREPATKSCCGAGSSHQILFPELTDELLKLKLQDIRESHTKYLLSDNIGCALNFKNGLHKSGLKIEVIHPITLLARQLA